MKNFFSYFFGIGEEEEFVSFTWNHLWPILVAIGVVVLIYYFRREIAACKGEAYFRYTLSFVMIISEMAYFWRLVGVPSLNPNPVDHLPITVCGWAVIFGSYMLVGRSQKLFDIVYFWTWAGTTFALITPTVISFTGPTRFRFYQFWIEHTAGYIAVFYMIFVHKMRPTKRSFVRAYAWLAVLALVAYTANQLIGPGANYLFMARPESTPSILDILPPVFALRILVMGAAVTLLFVLAYLPWYLMDRRAAHIEKERAVLTKENEEESILETV